MSQKMSKTENVTKMQTRKMPLLCHKLAQSDGKKKWRSTTPWQEFYQQVPVSFCFQFAHVNISEVGESLLCLVESGELKSLESFNIINLVCSLVNRSQAVL